MFYKTRVNYNDLHVDIKIKRSPVCIYRDITVLTSEVKVWFDLGDYWLIKSITFGFNAFRVIISSSNTKNFKEHSTNGAYILYRKVSSDGLYTTKASSNLCEVLDRSSVLSSTLCDLPPPYLQEETQMPVASSDPLMLQLDTSDESWWVIQQRSGMLGALSKKVA